MILIDCMIYKVSQIFFKALQRKTVVNSYDLSKETQAEKEKTKSNRRSLRLQAKAYLSKPSVCSDVNPAKKSEKQSNPNNFRLLLSRGFNVY